jgi:hypothetical protein
MRSLLFSLIILLALVGPAGAFRVTGDVPAGTVIDIRDASPTIEYTPRSLSGSGVIFVYSVSDLGNGTSADIIANGTLLGNFTAANNNQTFSWAPTGKKVVALSVLGGDFGRHGKVDVAGFNYVSGGGGPSPTVVNSFEELNTYFRTLDLAPGAQTTVDTFVMLGPDFTMDATSTTTEEIFLPVGGGEHPRITIDLGEHIIANEADPVLAIRFGNVNGECAVSTYSGYNKSTVDCNGVTHDYQFTLQNGMITTMTSAGSGGLCSPFPTTACNRTMLVLEDTDRLFYDAGGRYNGRSRLINLKLGATADTSTGGIGGTGNTWANGDECVSISAYTAELLVENSFLECFNGITLTAIDNSGGVSITSVPSGRYVFNAVHSANAPIDVGSNYQQLNGGFLRAEDNMSLAYFTGDVFLNSGTLGKTRGGTFDLDVRGTSGPNLDFLNPPSFQGECYDEADTDPATSFIDNATLAGTDEPIQGRINFTGLMCVQNWLYSDATGSMTFNSHFVGGPYDRYPAFYSSDTVDTSRQGYVMRVDAGATFTGSVEFNFTFEDALTADPTTSHDGATGVAWDAIVDPDIDAGTNLDNAYEHVTFKMGARGKRTDAGPAGADTIVVGPVY